MAESKKNPTSDYMFFSVIVVALCLVFYKFYNENKQEIIKTAIITICLLVGLAIYFLCIYLFYRRFKRKIELRNNITNDLIKIRTSDYADLDSLDVADKELEELQNYQLNNEQLELLRTAKDTVNYRRNRIWKERCEQENRRQKSIQEIREKNSIINKLVDYFKEKKSTKTIPKNATHLDFDTVNEAIMKYHQDYRDEQSKIESKNISAERWQEAQEFISRHKALPSDFGNMDDEEKNNHLKALRLLEQGKLKPAKRITEKILEEDEELVEEKFFYANKLKPEIRERLINNYGYRHKPFIFLDGRRGNNLIIKNDVKKESDYHFCLKHMLAEINEVHSQIEHQVGEMRADVAFLFGVKNWSLAIEIETGQNNTKQVEKKIKWLDENFDQWIILCSRQNKKKYKQYADNKKSYCMTLTQAVKKTQEIVDKYKVTSK